MPPFLPVDRTPGDKLIQAAMDRTDLSARALAQVIDVDERTMRRWIEGPDASGGREMPGPVRLLLALIAAQPTTVAKLQKLTAGLPLR